MQALHLTADLYNCRCDKAWLTDAERLQPWCLEQVQAAGLEAVHKLFHAWPVADGVAGGITATVLMPQSHISLHTCPADKTVTLDVYVCHASGELPARAGALMASMVERFQPEWTEQRSLDRGDGA